MTPGALGSVQSIAARNGSAVAGRLIEHLRATFEDDGLSYAESPVPLTRGFEAQIYGFRLSKTAGESSRPLILRILQEDENGQRAHSEAVVQQSLSRMGYPVPRVIRADIGSEGPGSSFLMMERIPGRMMVEEFFRPSALLVRLPGILARIQAGL